MWTATDSDVDAALARAHFERWPRQMNVVKDWFLPLGLHTAHDHAKTPVKNSEVAKRRAALATRWRMLSGGRREQRALLRELENLVARERAVHELDNGKDQVMTVLKLTLANLGIWASDQWFLATYAPVTWQRLEPFFRLPGHVVYETDTVHVEPRPFNDQQIYRDLAAPARLTAYAFDR